jgi:hypothetical protein
MRRTLVLAAAALLGCSKGDSAREHDCAAVRHILEAPNPTDTPRRYWDYEAPKHGETAILDASPYERLRKLDYRDEEVRAAVNAFVSETGWTFYTPYSAEADSSSAKARLAKLCDLPVKRVVPD